MDRILLSTLAHRSPEEVFPYVRSFTEYPRYTDHLKEVRVNGDGGVGSVYDLELAWWKLSYTARSRVTDISAPTSLTWQLVNHLDARGEWRVEPEPESAPPDVETASRIYFEAVYDPHSANEDAISLPRLVSLDWVVRKVEPKLLNEARTVVERLVADIEGRPRDVELTVHEMP
ncbi:Polyketide cyclase/dehydrase [Natrinema pellirubrum DSM 15624]|uniref:Polyketide cyclase / dehydrase and lipid transport n=1 Tax=Natrinema pellirubrum (strain DSM 15624 / CIP 106293 / JCM 10476 / NCIMB 786 / 157) TaxID=797303 RepID=L0JNK1_NATP1|nr:SRPBCC family protein [Natrinema pellirubrum]AGB32809.1 Polyketide cyclase / dehydrase and lipid transport [Natrinema pellirubrum DSM 15624]ELY75571.1 Polyketide cyclase/dehydrase [Natrinema pellirubrum DSM 15624]